MTDLDPHAASTSAADARVTVQSRAYATVAQFRAWTQDLFPEIGQMDDDEVARLLDRAAADLDAWLHWPPPTNLDAVLPGPGRIRAQLSSWEAWSLAKSNVEQAIYRLLVGEDTLAQGAPTLLGAGGVSFAQRAPDLIGPEALLSLCGCSVLWVHKSGTVAPDPVPLPILPPYAADPAY